jgi:hypothetical protein
MAGSITPFRGMFRPGAIVRHRSTGESYQVLGHSWHTEDEEWLIHYVSTDVTGAVEFSRPQRLFEDGRFRLEHEAEE